MVSFPGDRVTEPFSPWNATIPISRATPFLELQSEAGDVGLNLHTQTTTYLENMDKSVQTHPNNPQSGELALTRKPRLPRLEESGG